MVQTQLGFTREATQNYIEEARSVAKRLLTHRVYITSDDIWKHCPPPGYVHTNVMGQIFRGKSFKSIGWTKTKRPSSNGRAIQMYVLRGQE